jgi:hypothetical protein
MAKFLSDWWARTQLLWVRPRYIEEIRPKFRLPEDIMEEEIASMDMHYGDEPMYYSDPPEWPLDTMMWGQ